MTTPHDIPKLLQLAAKAIGGTFSPGSTQLRTGPTWDDWEWIGPMGIVTGPSWKPYPSIIIRPHENDGDSRRLEVALKINVQHDDESPVVWVYYTLPGKFSSDRDCEEYSDDPLAATRMAVLRAAAAIGEAMP